MFKIYFVNDAYEKHQVLMYDDMRDEDELKLGSPKLHIEVNAAGTLDFELPPTNVAYSKIIPMVTELHVLKDNQKTHNKRIWFGRVLTMDTDIYGVKTVHCEGGLAYLNDCIYYDKTVEMGSWSSSKSVGRALFARYESPILNKSGVHVYGVSPQEASAVIANIMAGGSNYTENLKTPFKHLGRIAKDTDPDVDVPVYAWVNEPVVPSGDQNDEKYYFEDSELYSYSQNQCGVYDPNNVTAVDLISSMMNNVGGLYWVTKSPYYPKRTFGGADLGDAVYVMQLHMRRSYPAFDENEGQTIQLGENLTDLTITDDGTTFFTAVHPHGQRSSSGEDFTLDSRGVQSGTTAVNKRGWQIDPSHGVMYCPELVSQYGMIIKDLDVGTTSIYEQLLGMAISEIDNIPLITKVPGGDWTTGIRELTVKGIDMSLYDADYTSIELTDAVRVLSPRHGVDTYLNTTAIDYDLQDVENTVFTLNAIKTADEMTHASSGYSGGSSTGGSSYVHPKHTKHDLGFYKFSNDSLGHVDTAVAVSKQDIVNLGIPDKNTTYHISSSENPDYHGVTLTDNQNRTSVAPLTSYRRTLRLRDYSSDGGYVDGRGYLLYTTGFQIKSEYGRYDSTHPVSLSGDYALGSDADNVQHGWNVIGEITAHDTEIIQNLKTDTTDGDTSLKVYAYRDFEEAIDGHEYILYHVWIAVYLNKDLSDTMVTNSFLSSIQYTDMEGLYLQSPPDSNHAIDYDALVLQNENAGNTNTTYTLTKNGTNITLTGSDGSSSSVSDSDTTYELAQYNDVHDGDYPDGPSISLKDSYGDFTDATVPRAMTYTSWDAVYRVNYGNLSGSGGNQYASLVDIVYHKPDSFRYNEPIIITVDGSIKVSAVYHSWRAIIVYSTGSIRANIYPPSVLNPPDTKWTLLAASFGYNYGVEDGTYETFQICVDQETMKKIFDVRVSASLIYTTSEKGELLKQAEGITKIDDALGSGGSSYSTRVILSSQNGSDVAFTGDYNDLSNKPAIPDISGKQDKSTAVTHTANTAVGSATKPVYVASNGVATAISHSINADVPANAKFTDTTYDNASTSTSGLMSAADKSKLDGMDLSKYLPLAGGTMNGDINMYANKKEVCIGSSPSTSNKTTPVGSAYLEIANSMSNAFPSLRSYIGSYENTNTSQKYIVISVRHRNGYANNGSDGNKYGMMIYSELLSDGDLHWNKQKNVGSWYGIRTILDSNNYKSYALAKDGTAVQADTLTDSGWSTVTTYVVDTTKFTAIATTFRKIGQTAWVKCVFTPSTALTNFTVCDVAKVDPFISVTPAISVYGIGSNADGTDFFHAEISYSPDRKLYLKGSFKANIKYRLMFSYPVT